MSVSPALVEVNIFVPVCVDLPRCDPFPRTVDHLSVTSSRQLQPLLHINDGVALDQHICLEFMCVRIAVLEGEDETVPEKDVCHGDIVFTVDSVERKQERIGRCWTFD